jgi:hypothetical protein
VPFAVVLDACVLYPLPLRDTLLRCAEQNLYEVRWSRRILDELARNLVEDCRASPGHAAKLIAAIQRSSRTLRFQSRRSPRLSRG